MKDWKFGGRAGEHDSRQLVFVSWDENGPGCRRAHVAAMMKRKFRNFSFWTNHSISTIIFDFNMDPHAALLFTIKVLSPHNITDFWPQLARKV